MDVHSDLAHKLGNEFQTFNVQGVFNWFPEVVSTSCQDSWGSNKLVPPDSSQTKFFFEAFEIFWTIKNILEKEIKKRKKEGLGLRVLCLCFEIMSTSQ